MGAMLACILAFIYSMDIVRRYPPKTETAHIKRNRNDNVIESAITGIFMSVSLLVGHFLNLNNPYWIPISYLTVMQGVTLHHIWQRNLHRILGTFAGLGATWLLLQFRPTPLSICIFIFIIQFIVEMLVVRNYGLAVIFITPLTILLAEAGSAMTFLLNTLIPYRLRDNVIGSIIGAIAGKFIHNEQLRQRATSSYVKQGGLF